MKYRYKKGKCAAFILALVLSCCLTVVPVMATAELPPAGAAIGDTIGETGSVDPVPSETQPVASAPDVSSNPSGTQEQPPASSSGNGETGITGPIGGDGIIITPPSESSQPDTSLEPSIPDEEWGNSQPSEEESFPEDGEWGEGGSSSFPEDESSSVEGESSFESSDPEYYEPAPPSYSGPVVDTAPNMIASVPQEDSEATPFTNQDLEDIRNLTSGAMEGNQGQTGSQSNGEALYIPQGGGIFESENPVETAGDSTVLVIGIVLIVLGASGIAFAIVRMILAKKHHVVPSSTDGPRDLYSDSHLEPSAQESQHPSAPVHTEYYDDPNNDPYSDYYDDVDSYAGTSPKTNQPSSRQDYSAPQNDGADADNGKGKDSSGDFDWDDFFKNSANHK